jgi:hypothetical protein
MGLRGARALRLAVAAAVLAAALPAAAHWVQPEEVVARLADPANRAAFDVVGAAQDPRLSRLLVVRVGPRWPELDPGRRREVAEEWRQLWRDATPAGVLAITDAAGRSMVSFDAHGRAQLR